MLLRGVRPARIRNKPRLVASGKSTTCRRITAYISHHTCDHDSFSAVSLKLSFKIRVHKSVISILPYDWRIADYLPDFRHKLPALSIHYDGFLRTNFSNELILDGWDKLLRPVAVLSEDDWLARLSEVFVQKLDLRHRSMNHLAEVLLHVDNQ